MDGLEGLIVLIWFMVLVGSVLRAVIQARRRAEQGAAKRAMQRAPGRSDARTPAPRRAIPDLGKQVFRTGWPVYPGQPAQPVVVVEPDQSLREGVSSEGVSAEGDDAEGDDAEGGYSTEGDGRDIHRRLRQERSDEWQSEGVRKWEMPAGTGSLGDVGEALDEPMLKSADTFSVEIEQETMDWASDEEIDAGGVGAAQAGGRREGDAGGWQLPGRVGPGQALAGIVWGTVLGSPRCRLTRHGR
ncbi:MAG TPA: hypothetical protein DDZ84_11565 [Firmicutes bacterium]|nr:hypothetical protein [Bacillota bacterium]